jgi:hypothetical protein
MESDYELKRLAFRKKVHECVLANNDPLIQVARFLRNSSKLKTSIRLNEKGEIGINELFHELVSLPVNDLEQKKLDLEIIVANLFNPDRKPVMVSLRRKAYTKEKNSTFTINLVHLLHDAGYINWKPGFYDPVQGKGKMTRIWKTDKLSEYFEPLGPIRRFHLEEEILMKDENKNLVKYSDIVQSIRLRDDIRRINKVNEMSKVECLHPNYRGEKIDTQLFAVYNNSSWKEGGRLYTSEFGYQMLHKEFRPFLTIDGQSTTESDYQGLHIRMLYAQEGIQYPLDADPYACLESYCPELRKFFKTMLLALLNADSLKKAEKAACYSYRQDWELKCTLRVIEKGIPELLDQFTYAHPHISKHFTSGAGLKLMNTDSKMALHVLKHFTKMRIPILSIHDSFLVQEQHREELRMIMDMAFRKYANGFSCPIKEK